MRTPAEGALLNESRPGAGGGGWEGSGPNELEVLISAYRRGSSIRSDALFREFLPAGYRLTTLDSVRADRFSAVVLAKVHLGMLITLYDDFADHPRHLNPRLLSRLYGLNLGCDQPMPGCLTAAEKRTFELARYLFDQLDRLLARVSFPPHYTQLLPVLRFDLEQFYTANRHAELMTRVPGIRNLTEARQLGPHNMGMVAAGTIDLMATDNFDCAELGRCREVFLLGQRLGRISNLVLTFDRERAEGDATNEIEIASQAGGGSLASCRRALLQEFSEKLVQVRAAKIGSFGVDSYAGGLLALHGLHRSFQGVI